MTNRKRHWILTMPLAAALVAAIAVPVAAAPAPSMTATLTADANCQLTATVTWKNMKVAHIYVSWYEVGFQNPDLPGNPDFVATSEWPGLAPYAGVAKGKTVTFGFGPTQIDTASHDWSILVSPYDAAGVALPQVSATLVTNCYVPPNA